jgi:hypothetical protein
MAFGQESSLQLHISGHERVTAGWVATTLTSLDYSYNVAAAVELLDQGFFSDHEMMIFYMLLRDAEMAGIETTDSALRTLIYEDAQLVVTSVTSVNSFTVNLFGLDKVIKEIRESCGRHGREKRRLQNEEQRLKNEAAEAAANEFTNQQKHDSAMRILAFFEGAANAHKRLAKVMGEEQATKVIEMAAQEYQRGLQLPPGTDGDPEPEAA